jgi:hypothetical protein
MEKSFRLRIERGSSSKTNWFYDTIFTIHENEKESIYQMVIVTHMAETLKNGIS